MNFIVAVIKPRKLDQVRQALSALGVQGMTVTDVKGYGRQKGAAEIYRGVENQLDFRPKTKIEVAVSAQQAAAAVHAIREASNTNSIGDGKIFVFDLTEVVRVRTGEDGIDAL